MIKFINIFFLSFLLTQSISAKKEQILFDLKFGFVKGGEAKIIITDTTFNGKPAIYYYLSGRTTGITEVMYGVNDIYETIADAKTGLPLKNIRNIKEHKYRWYNESYFYHDVDSVNSIKTGWIAIPDNTTDFLSVLFYYTKNFLSRDAKPGKSVTLPNYHADKVSTITINYLGDKNIKTALGELNTWMLTAVVDKGKLLNSSDGLRFYISKDKKIPVALDFDLKVGGLNAVLKSYKINNVEQVTK
ncbi:MAG TPA: DUF3108 domain-containing protein [Draconibacterium sp.]|nr:DUF3108 domain-containing protein [Draconibacterium sp.]